MKLFQRGRTFPLGEDVVVTSAEVLEGGLPVVRIVRASRSWMFLSAQEAEDSEALAVHFDHLALMDPSIRVELRPGEYAIRGLSLGGRLGDWRTMGPYNDRIIDSLLFDGTVDRQQEGLSRELD